MRYHTGIHDLSRRPEPHGLMVRRLQVYEADGVTAVAIPVRCDGNGVGREKGVDVRIALEMARLGRKGLFDGATVDLSYVETYAYGMATRILPKTHLRDRIREEIDGLGDHTVVVTERGRPVAVLVSVGRWNELQESLEELDDAVAVFESRSGRDRGVPAEQTFSRIEAEEADVSGSARQAG